ncbi:MAG TPA: alpha-L-fucosidase [Chthonomonadaceae bacterium]|nr:alpha-L-fucosidase [Chthonomonadaceae bacterium]
MRLRHTLFLSALLLFSLVRAQAQTFAVNPEAGETEAQFAARTQWWRDAKFGMFIHWGIYAVPADSTQGAAEWYFYNHTDKDPVTGQERHLQVRNYEKFAAQFDPVQFNARQWVKVAKDAGMRYIVITSKHHDGFCMFDSKLTDYNIVHATPFHHDPMKDLAAECKRQGLTFCFYHSIMDWHNPDYLPRRSWDDRPVDGASLDKYLDIMQGQLRELLTNYGRIGVIWFDGGWEHNAEQLHALEVVKMIRSLQPGILINDRIDLPEDFSTPEQSIPANALPNGRLWETCMTMNDTWGYSKNDHDWKSAPDLIHKLCDIASKGGNFLLNVGPTDQGTFPPEILDRLAQIGRWMKVNGESIYGTTKSPFRRLSFDGRCTQKGDTLYLQVFSWPQDGMISLPGLKTKVESATALAGHEGIAVTEQDGVLQLHKPARHLDPVATVLKLELAGPPEVEDQSLVLHPNTEGVFSLLAADADIQGRSAQVETKDNIPNIGYWLDPKDTVAWTVDVPKAGAYQVALEVACTPEAAGSAFRVVTGDSATGVEGTVPDTGGWDKFQTETLPGTLSLPAGRQTIRVVPLTMPHGAIMNLRKLVLTPTP